MKTEHTSIDLKLGSQEIDFLFAVNMANLPTEKGRSTSFKGLTNLETESWLGDHILNAKFWKVESPKLEGNLIMVDSYLHIIIAELILLSWQYRENRLHVLVDKLIVHNPNQYRAESQPVITAMYEAKIKNFLIALSCGFRHTEVWNGNIDQIEIQNLCSKYAIYPRANLGSHRVLSDFLFSKTVIGTKVHNLGSMKQEFDNTTQILRVRIDFSINGYGLATPPTSPTQAAGLWM